MLQFLKIFKTTRMSAKEPTPAVTEAEPVQTGFLLTGYVVSDVGSLRSNNEDNYCLGSQMNENSQDHREASLAKAGGWQIAGVFDGMGGGEAGELASRGTAEIFADLPHGVQKAAVDQEIRSSFLRANNKIVDLQSTYQVFGTTGTVFCSNGQEYKLYHLGDSRAYLLQNGELVQLTRDQTLAQMKLEVGMYREDDPAAEADKHKLTEYIGRDWTRENLRPVESLWTDLQPGDRFLICSDGLYDMCSHEEIRGILMDAGSAKEQADQLLALAISRGGVDNITCMVLSFSDPISEKAEIGE